MICRRKPHLDNENGQGFVLHCLWFALPLQKEKNFKSIKTLDRTFHRRFTIAAKSGIIVFSLLAFYFFWTMKAVIGLLLVIIIVGMIDRVMHTTYTFRRVEPIDREGEFEFLIISKGHFSRNENIPLDEITKVARMRTALRTSRYLLITYGPGNVTGVQPDDEEAFVRELEKRRKK